MLPTNNNHRLISNSFSTYSIDTNCAYENYLTHWTEWKNNRIQEEQRDIAFQRLVSCLQNQETNLDLSELGLTTLPEIPPGIKSINISKNNLSLIPPLPTSLTQLNVSYNKLIELPALPQGLELLNASHNQLITLPILPISLKELHISNNQLCSLPVLPELLETLDASCNGLAVLPPLSFSLQELSVIGNLLSELPPLPHNIHSIWAIDNMLTDIPYLPENLRNGYFDINRISYLPESILNLGNECSISICDNPISSFALQRLTSSPDYHGPQIHFSMSDGQQHTSVRPLPEAVAAWFPQNKQSDVSQIWLAFEREEHANTFSAFLDRLADTVSARNAQGFRQQVSAFLEKLSTSAELRQQSFAVAADATESCEDRVALTWNNLRKTLLVHQASEGLFDNDTGALLSLGREMFRLEILEDIARDKVRTLRFVDEIEVYLAFQTMLAEKLQLSTAVKEMRFYGVSGVTENDLRTAEAMVRSREENEFTDWFALWGPWHAVLKRTEADRWAQAEEQKYEMLENEYPQRVADRLKASGLSDDADAEREAGAQVMRETEQQIYRQLTDEVLALRLPENGSRLHHS
ncbi:E3 ubiquitin--protein ligase [Escherichia coli]|nr:E3 ubiquitin--protein ligase [Escherichia coli]EGF7408932.1 E3 ubiquitin--protein ligase [Escherichia coli]EGF7450059.1 E3 ubiquitin--protein ligase [Escherichia coli]